MSFERKQYEGAAKPATLVAAINDTATTFTINSYVGWPDGSDGPFVVCMDRATSLEEKMLCSGLVPGSGGEATITVTTRGYDGTSAVNHGTTVGGVEHVIDAATIDQANRYVNLQANKGDLVAHDGTNAQAVAVGSDGDVVVADSSATSGIAYSSRLTDAEADIATNTSAIATNATAISTNATAIASNSTAISNNATAISNNATAISNNATAIATNATAISNNATAIASKLNSSSYTADDVLTKIKTVDGIGSGLDADTLDGVSSGSFLRSDANDTATGQVTFYRSVSSDWSDATIIVESANEQCSLAIRGGTTSTTYDKNTIQLRPGNTGGGSPEPNLYFQNHNNTDQANIQVKNIYYSGTLVPVSSRTVKNTIQDYNGATAVIDALRPVTFIFNNSPHMGTQVGLVAEEVAEVDSKFVVDADVPSLNLNSIVGLAIAGLQEANTRITALEARIAELKG